MQESTNVEIFAMKMIFEWTYGQFESINSDEDTPASSKNVQMTCRSLILYG